MKTKLMIAVIFMFLSGTSMQADEAPIAPQRDLKALPTLEKVKIQEDINKLAEIVARIDRMGRPNEYTQRLGDDDLNNYIHTLGYTEDDLWHLKTIYESYQEVQTLQTPKLLVMPDETPTPKVKAEIEVIEPETFEVGDVVVYKSPDGQTTFPVRVEAFVLNTDAEQRIVVKRQDRPAGFVTDSVNLSHTDSIKIKELKPQFDFEIGERVHRQYIDYIIKDRKSLWGKNLYLVKRLDPAFSFDEILEESDMQYISIYKLINP